MKIAVINNKVLRPDRASGCKRLYGLLKILAENNEVHYYSLCRSNYDSHYIGHLNTIDVHVRGLDENEFVRSIGLEKYDCVICEFYHVYYRIGYLLKINQPKAVIVLDTVDIHFVRFRYEVLSKKRSIISYLIEKRIETSLCQLADFCITVSSKDKDVLSNYGVSDVHVVPNINQVKPRLKKERSSFLAFVGGFSHSPNKDGLLWFIKEVWPVLIKNNSDVILKIVGGGLDKEIQGYINNLQRITYLGYVERLEDIYDETRVVIAPLTYGSGIKGKVTEAMSLGIPLVGTSIAVEGIPVIDGIHCYVADEPHDFAEKINRLLKDRDNCEKFSRNSQALAKSLYSPDAVKENIMSLLATVSDRKNTINNSKGDYSRNSIGIFKSFKWIAIERKMHYLTKVLFEHFFSLYYRYNKLR